jgi:hypothetical protein
MMAVVWKYPLELGRAQRLLMPRDAVPLAVQMQGDVPTLWAMVDPTQPLAGRLFIIFGTGHNINLPPGCKDVRTASIFGLQYIGTFQQGPYVWHVFEERERG